MKLPIFFVMCVGGVGTGLHAADTDEFFSEMKGRITKWESHGLEKTWVNQSSAEDYEFYIWDVEVDALQWFIIQICSNEDLPSQVTIHFGVDESRIGSRVLGTNQGDYLLSEISSSELFNLPLIAIKDPKRTTFFSTGISFFLGRQKKADQVREVFRWVGVSYPVDKVIDALTRVTVPN